MRLPTGLAPRLGADAYELGDQPADPKWWEAAVKISASLGQATEELRVQNKRYQELANAIRVIAHIPLPLITASNTPLNQPELMGPRTGYAWEVRRITAATFTGGTVNIYIDGVADSNIVLPFAQAGTTFLGGGQLIIQDGHWLIAQGSTLTGNVSISLGVIEIAQPWLGAYLL